MVLHEIKRALLLLMARGSFIYILIVDWLVSHDLYNLFTSLETAADHIVECDYLENGPDEQELLS